MKFEVEGKEVEIDDSAVFEKAKSLGEFNQEIDRIVDKRLAPKLDEITTKYDAEKAELISTYSREIENTKKMSSGKKDEQISALQEQIQTLSDSFGNAQKEAEQLRQENLISGVKNDLLSKFADVSNEYDRKNMVRDTMESLTFTDGKPQFKLKSGAFGSADDIIQQFKTDLPDRFLSKQPNGAGLKGGGGNVTVPPNTKFSDMTTQQKVAYLEQKKGN